MRLNGETQDYDFYPQRRHIRHEFDRIWEEQARHHPSLLTDDAREVLERILFYQRPLKDAKVGVCLFAGRDGIPPDEPRLPEAHPLFQQRRLYEEVNQLEITTPGEPSRKLTLDERDRLILALRTKARVSFATLAGRVLKLQPDQSFNKASENRTELAGDEVHAALAAKRFGEAGWSHLSTERQWAIIERLQEEEDPEKLHAFLTADCGLDDNAARETAKAPLPEGHGRLGLVIATTRILDQLKADVVTYSKAVERCGWHHSDDRTGEVLDRLPYYGELLSREISAGSRPRRRGPARALLGKITNPTVHIGLRQLEKLVNAVIAVHGRPDQIVVELARELNLNERDKDEQNRRIRKETLEGRAPLAPADRHEGNRTGDPVAPDTARTARC
ncbi:type II CRISPR RNA-guided endonuclease Cas9 [Sphingomonas sp. MMS24-JH45]